MKLFRNHIPTREGFLVNRHSKKCHYIITHEGVFVIYKYSRDMKKSQEVKTNIIEFGNKKFLVEPTTGELLEILSDKTKNGKVRPWREHKIENQTVEECYRRIADGSSERDYWEKRADRLHDCGVHLWFNVYSDGNGGETMKIKHAESCRVRLCPLCTWRRSIKIQTHTHKILEAMQKEKEYAYILVTLTVPNVTADKLSDKITDMMKSWDRFQHYKVFGKAVKGWYRGLEVTHNVEKYRFKWVKDRKTGKKRKVYIVDDNGNRLPNPSYDTYHPHFHCIMAVEPSYFKHSDYISHEKWLEMWQKATKDPTITQVDVRRVKPKKPDKTGVSFADMIMSAVCEVAKYTVKSSDYILPWDWDMSCKSVEVLDKALANRRLVAYGGVMKDWHKKLNLDDEIDGDLIEDGETPNGEVIREVCAFWNVGYQQYVIVEG